MLNPDRLRVGFHVFVETDELARRLTEHAAYLRTKDAAREEVASNAALRADPNAIELTERLCSQRAELCEFMATHLPYGEELVSDELEPRRDGVLLALPMQELNALLPLLGFKLTVTVRAPAIQAPGPGVPPPGRFMR